MAFCLAVRNTHPSNSSFRSGLSSTISPSEKNCARVIPKPLQIDSSVGIDGVAFRLKIFMIVDSDRLDSFASRYSLQPRAASKAFNFSCVSKKPPPCMYAILHSFIVVSYNGSVMKLALNYTIDPFSSDAIAGKLHKPYDYLKNCLSRYAPDIMTPRSLDRLLPLADSLLATCRKSN